MQGQSARPRRSNFGVRLILTYKALKALLQLGAALFIATHLARHEPLPLASLVSALHRHATRAWAARLAELVAKQSSPRNLEIVAAALGFDGLLCALEGLALASGREWGLCIVAASSAALVPFELVELVRAPHVSRALILIFNVTISGYLARRAYRLSRPS